MCVTTRFYFYAGRYPAYDGHPKFLVDWELKKRDKALSLQEEISRREDVLGTLHQKVFHAVCTKLETLGNLFFIN